jgi:hypothetical protein
MKSVFTHNDLPRRRCLVQTLFKSLSEQSRPTHNSQMHYLHGTSVLVLIYDTLSVARLISKKKKWYCGAQFFFLLVNCIALYIKDPLKNLTVAQPVRKFPSFYKPRRFLTFSPPLNPILYQLGSIFWLIFWIPFTVPIFQATFRKPILFPSSGDKIKYGTPRFSGH